MSIVVIELGAFVLLAKYVHQKQVGGVYYFRRRIPDDVRQHFPDNKTGVLFFSLKTKDRALAAKWASRHAVQQDALWKTLRDGQMSYGPDQMKAAEELLRNHNLKPGDGNLGNKASVAVELFIDHLFEIAGTHGAPRDAREISEQDGAWYEHLPDVYRAAGDLLYGAKRRTFLSEAVKDFQKRRLEEADTKSGTDRIRVVDQFISWFGDRPVDQYSRQDANEFVTKLLAKGNSPSTVRRRLNSIAPVFKDAALEGEFEHRRIFDGIKIPGLGVISSKRLPFSIPEIALIQRHCLSRNDEPRWIVAMLSDTGMRIAEAIGLRVQDVFLDDPIPYVSICPHEARPLKTAVSERRVPLVGAALWAARSAVNKTQGTYLFPRYIDDRKQPPTHKATHASNALVKWIRSLPIDDKERKVAHSFRHSMQDRLRAVETPEEIRNAIGGWTNRGVGQGYGQGYQLDVLAKYLELIVIQQT